MEDVDWYSTSHREGGTQRWMAREQLMEGAPKSCSTDVYSFGCLALEVRVAIVDLMKIDMALRSRSVYTHSLI